MDGQSSDVLKVQRPRVYNSSENMMGVVCVCQWGRGVGMDTHTRTHTHTPIYTHTSVTYIMFIWEIFQIQRYRKIGVV